MKRRNNEKTKQNPPQDNDLRKRYKDHDLRICTWNVRTLYRPGASFQLADVLAAYRADITAVQELRWTGHGCRRMKKCDVYYSCHADRHEFGCGFVVGKRLRHLVSRFTPVSDRIATIRIKAKFFNITLICVHAPTEAKDDETKDAFYERLEETYDRCPNHDIKIVLGDFNAKLGRESVFSPTIGNFSLHENTTDNGMRLVDFAAARNMVVSSTRFQHKPIHKATWISPDRNTSNQIDHVVVDGRHASSVMDVRSIRGANIDSDHYLVAAKIRTRLSKAKNVRDDTQRKLDVEKLHNPQISTAYSNAIAENLRQNVPTTDDPSAQWQHIAHSILHAGKSILGYRKPPKGKPWYDEECRNATMEKDAAYMATLQPLATRAVIQRNKDKRKEATKLFDKKRQEYAIRESKEIEELRGNKDSRKFYQKVSNRAHGFCTGLLSCKDENGNLVTDTQKVMEIWRDHFSKLLTNEEDNDNISMENDGIECPTPDLAETRKAISRLKNGKAAGADGLPAELFKHGGEELLKFMHHLICKIWQNEIMPEDWSLSVLCPVYKKGDPSVCANYRGISLLPIGYRILSSILCERLKPIVSNVIGPYQCGFRPGKSTTDQIFTLRQILEKTREKRIDTYHLFVDYKAAFDSPIRSKLYEAMSEFGIPAKLIRLCKMTLTDTKSSVKIGNNLTEPFETKRGLRQGDSLSCTLFNIVMEAIMRKAAVNTSGTIFSRSHMLLAYADDIDIVARNLREVTAVFSKIEEESVKMGLVVNEDKTKLMVSTDKNKRLGKSVNADNYNFEIVNEFVYLGSSVNKNNNVSLEIGRRIMLANRCFYGLSKYFRDKTLTTTTKLLLYRTLILPVLMYSAECWTILQRDEAVLGVFERKILRKIYGPIVINGEYRRRMNHELYQLYNDIDVVKRIKIKRLSWLGHVARMSETVPARKVLDYDPVGTRKQGRPKLRWINQAEETLSKLGVSGWRKRAQDRSAWNSLLNAANSGVPI